MRLCGHRIWLLQSMIKAEDLGLRKGMVVRMNATVVIPNYNGMKYLDSCMESIYAGSVIPEVIVVDNGSSDGSIEQMKEKHQEVKVLRFKENKGFCAAVNAGIKEADTEYVILLNNDTKVDQYFTERLIKAIQNKKKAFSVGAKMLSMKDPDIIDDAGDLYCALGWAFALGKDKNKENYSKPSEIFAACAGAAIYKKSVFEVIGYLDENHFAYLEDMDIGYRAKIAGYHNYFAPEAICYHAGSGVSGSRYNEFKVRLSSRNSIYLIYKNMPFVQILINLIFLIPGFIMKYIFFIKKNMGKIYVRGILEGIRLSFSEKGRNERVRFRSECFGNYIKIQFELWINIVRRFVG